MRSSVSRTALRHFRAFLPAQTSFPSCVRWNSAAVGSRRWSTPLAQQLSEAITTTGPIPVASYMRQCLTSDLGGYYSSSARLEGDQFGVKGDFVTSPEISQIFGELLGLWIVAEWIAQGRKSSGIQLIEVGPGRGTLMDDILRAIRNFPDLTRAIDTVHLVEASPALRETQHKLLCGEHALSTTDTGHKSQSRHSDALNICWSEDIRLVRKDASTTPFIIAHEFFDALPIHVFQAVKPAAGEETTIGTPTGPVKPQRRLPQGNQWREMLVSPKPPHRLTPGDDAEFELSLSKSATPHSMYLPETSPRYRALKDVDGAIIEVSPESLAYVQDFARRIGGSGEETSTATDVFLKSEPSGAALLIDYGPAANIPTNSLRGIRAHQRVSPFSSAGTTDVSADVDFLALAESALDASPNVEVHGPVDQGRFLTAMGIQERAAQLVKRAMTGERVQTQESGRQELTEVAKRIESGWRRLVDQSPQGMGRLYQVMAILPHKPASTGHARRRPVGFGGDITL